MVLASSIFLLVCAFVNFGLAMYHLKAMREEEAAFEKLRQEVHQRIKELGDKYDREIEEFYREHGCPGWKM